MPAPIPLVSRMSDDEERLWLDALSKAAPKETIISSRQLSANERAGAEIAIVADPDPANLREMPSLKWVHSLWAGVEKLVMELGEGAPPIVRMVDPSMSQTMAEAVLAWTYYLHRDMPFYARSQHERAWRPRPYRRPEQVNVGLLGLGELGAAAARRLCQARFNVIGWSRTPKSINGVTAFHGAEGLPHVLRQSDILVCLMPLTPSTAGLLNAERLALLPKGANVINFARGPIIVTQDLLAALDAGDIDHAVLDVFDAEPLPEDSPLWGHPKVTVLPHISAPTDQDTASQIVAKNIACYRETGAPPATVNTARGY